MGFEPSYRIDLPVLASLGLGNLKPLASTPPAANPFAGYGRCALASPGKDTTAGHWEMAGIHLEKPFPLFPNGFSAGGNSAVRGPHRSHRYRQLRGIGD